MTRSRSAAARPTPASGLLSAHRALEVARDLHEAGRWNGTGLIVIHAAYDSYRTASYEWLGGLAALKEGEHYEIVQAL